MSYNKQTWVKDESPLSAERFNHMEDGIKANSDAIDNMSLTADNVSYDNTETGIEADNVQDALDYLKEHGGSGGSSIVEVNFETWKDMPESQRNNGTEWGIIGDNEHGITNVADFVLYKNGTVKDALDKCVTSDGGVGATVGSSGVNLYTTYAVNNNNVVMFGANKDGYVFFNEFDGTNWNNIYSNNVKHEIKTKIITVPSNKIDYGGYSYFDYSFDRNVMLVSALTSATGIGLTFAVVGGLTVYRIISVGATLSAGSQIYLNYYEL